MRCSSFLFVFITESRLRHKVERIFWFEENHSTAAHFASGDLKTGKMEIQLRERHLGLAGLMEKPQDLGPDGLHNGGGAGGGNGSCDDLPVPINRQAATRQALHGRTGLRKYVQESHDATSFLLRSGSRAGSASVGQPTR